MLRHISRDFITRKKHGKMLADYLIRVVADRASGAFVPGNNTTIWIKHEDRIVLGAIDQQTKPFLAIAQGLHRLVSQSHGLVPQRDIIGEQNYSADFTIWRSP